MEHKLKTWTTFFEKVKNGSKTFECRKNDRDFFKGDILALEEWNVSGGYTGDKINFLITYILTDDFEGVAKGYCIMGIKKISEAE